MGADKRNDGVVDQEQEDEALFHSYMTSCAVYYVQSPSSNASHANSSECRNHESPFPLHNFSLTNHPNNSINNTHQLDVSRFMLSRYSSSRGSHNAFHHGHEKKISYDDLRSHGTGNEDHSHPLHGEEDDDIDDDDEDDGDGERASRDDHKDRCYVGSNIIAKRRKKRKGCWRFFTFDESSSCCWISLQIFWRLMVSFGTALFVFYMATKPPSPKMSIKVGGVREFVLGEGVDGSGVSTKILSTNCSVSLAVENKSKLFGLHIRPSKIEMSFGPLVFATSQSMKLYAPSHGPSRFELFVSTTSKPMYGAGRSMQDMLESGKGLPLLIRLRLISSFRVVGNLINPTFHHQAECALLLHRGYDKRHHTQAYNSTCIIAYTR